MLARILSLLSLSLPAALLPAAEWSWTWKPAPEDKALPELDLNVKNTMIRHGNYDYLSHSIAWDAAISDHAIPNRYFRSRKPEWFGNLAYGQSCLWNISGESVIQQLERGLRKIREHFPQAEVATY
jgi:hypothetical protein